MKEIYRAEIERIAREHPDAVERAQAADDGRNDTMDIASDLIRRTGSIERMGLGDSVVVRYGLMDAVIETFLS